MEDRPGKIFVGGLDFDIDEAEFEKIFSKFGKITEVLLKRDQQTNKSRGFGFITYENPSDADEAVKELDKQEIKGKMVHVDHAVKPGGGGPGGDRGGRGGFRGRGAPRGGSFRGRGGFRDDGPSGRGGFGGRSGFRGRGSMSRGDRGGGRGFGGRGRGDRGGFGDRPSRGGFDRSSRGFTDDRRGPMSSQRRSSMDRGFNDRPMRRDDERDRFGSSLDRDRYGSLTVSDRRPRDMYTSSPPRTLDRDRDIGSYRDYSSRDYSPPRDYISRDRLTSSRDYGSSRDLGVSSRSSYDLGRDSLSSRDLYGRKDDYLSPRESSRDYISPRDSPRDYLSSRETSHSLRDYDRGPSRDFDSYRDRMPSSLSRGYGGGSPPPRGRSPPPSRSAYSPPRGAPMGRDLDRDRVRDYSPGSRRPAPYDSPRGGPPIKRSRPDDGLSRSLPPRDGPPRGIVRDMPMRDSLRGPPRDSSRGGLGSFRR